MARRTIPAEGAFIYGVGVGLAVAGPFVWGMWAVAICAVLFALSVAVTIHIERREVK